MTCRFQRKVHRIRSLALLTLLGLFAATATASAQLTRERIDTLTTGLKQYRAAWTAQDTVALLRGAGPGKRVASKLVADDGRKWRMEVLDADKVLIEGRDVTLPPLPPKPRPGWMLYLCVFLSLALCLSGILNFRLLLARYRPSNARRTDVIRSISKL